MDNLMQINETGTSYKQGPKRKRNKKRKELVTIVFNEEERKDFLCGFRKRKQERKKKARDDLDKQLKEEKKRIKKEAKDAYKKLVVSHRDIPDVKEMLGKFENENTNVIDMDTHSVEVTELNPAQLAEKNNWIGINQTKYEKDVSEQSEDESEIVGMETVTKINKTKNLKKDLSLRTEKDVRKLVKNVATKEMKKSKVYRLKNKFDHIRNKKRRIGEDNGKNRNGKRRN